MCLADVNSLRDLIGVEALKFLSSLNRSRFLYPKPLGDSSVSFGRDFDSLAVEFRELVFTSLAILM